MIKFAVKSLLGTPALREVHHFVGPMMKIKDKLPTFLPALAEALSYMDRLQDSNESVSFDFLDISQQRLLFRSTLYKEFVAKRAKAKVQEEMARAQKGEKLNKALLEDLLAGPVEESVKHDIRVG